MQTKISSDQKNHIKKYYFKIHDKKKKNSILIKKGENIIFHDVIFNSMDFLGYKMKK